MNKIKKENDILTRPNSVGGGAYAVINPSTFYDAGLGGVLRYVIRMLVDVTNHGYIPVIDMQHHDSQYFRDGMKFKENVWEYYFEQPCNVGLEDIKKIYDNSKIRIITQDYVELRKPLQFVEFCTPEEVQNYPYKKIAKQYIRLNKKTKKYIDENIEKLIGNETSVLGILCRGTDYVNMRPVGHSIAATPEMIIKDTKELLKKYNYKKVYVATEDLGIYKKFEEAFGDLLIPNTQYKYGEYEDKEKLYLAEVKAQRANHNYLLGYEYLLSMNILARCNAFIASNSCTGVALCSFFSDFYKNMDFVKIYDRGRYKIRKNLNYKNIFERIFSIKKEIYENITRKVVTIFGFKIKFIKEIR